MAYLSRVLEAAFTALEGLNKQAFLTELVRGLANYLLIIHHFLILLFLLLLVVLLPLLYCYVVIIIIYTGRDRSPVLYLYHF